VVEKEKKRKKKCLMCVSWKKNHRNKNQASTSMGFLWFSGSAKNEEEKEEGRKTKEGDAVRISRGYFGKVKYEISDFHPK
jgi:gluconate kinase